MKEIELKRMYLEQERKITPLKPHWLQKDFMQPCEAVLVYYQIEPAMEQLKARDMQIIKAVDYLGIYDVLMSSEFILKSPPSIKFVDFVQWAISKGFGLPEHLKHVQQGHESNKSEEEGSDEEGVSLNLSSVKLPLLLTELAKRLMKKISPESKYASLPANEIVKFSDEFKSLRAVVRAIRDGKDYEDEWYQRKTSSVGPRKRK